MGGRYRRSLPEPCRGQGFPKVFTQSSELGLCNRLGAFGNPSTEWVQSNRWAGLFSPPKEASPLDHPDAY